MKRRLFAIIQLVLFMCLIGSSPVQAADPIKLSLIAGPIGSAWYSLASGFVKVIQTHCPDITITLEVGAAVKNVRVIAQNPNIIGFTNLDLAYSAITGGAPFDQKLPLRGLMAGHPSQVHIFTTEDSGINKIEDLRGKAVSIGAPGSGTETSARNVLNAHGITYNDIKPKRLNTQETCDNLKDRIISAGFVFSGIPIPSLMELTITNKIKIIPIRSEMIKKIEEKYPYIYKYTIPAGTYKGQSAPVDTIAWDTYLIANSALPNDVCYKMVKALLEHNEDLVAAHPTGVFWTLEKTAQKMIVPRHPGAEKYLREKGKLK
jgi:TRAP transporter TAXI family solute receptor